MSLSDEASDPVTGPSFTESEQIQNWSRQALDGEVARTFVESVQLFIYLDVTSKTRTLQQHLSQESLGHRAPYYILLLI